MKKKVLNIYFLLTILTISLERTHAFELNINDQNIFLYFIFGLFMLVGVILIVLGGKKKEDKPYFEADDKKTKQKNKDLNLEEEEFEPTDVSKSFNPDSIFKTIPTFSNKKFFEGTYKKLEKNIEGNYENINDIVIVKKAIVEFKDEEKKYVIKSEFIVSFTDNEKKKTNHKYIITSENSKEKEAFDRCPNCGGKIKNKDLLRCTYCHSILSPAKENSINNNWKVTNIEEIEKKEIIKKEKSQ